MENSALVGGRVFYKAGFTRTGPLWIAFYASFITTSSLYVVLGIIEPILIFIFLNAIAVAKFMDIFGKFAHITSEEGKKKCRTYFQDTCPEERNTLVKYSWADIPSHSLVWFRHFVGTSRYTIRLFDEFSVEYAPKGADPEKYLVSYNSTTLHKFFCLVLECSMLISPRTGRVDEQHLARVVRDEIRKARQKYIGLDRHFAKFGLYIVPA